MSKIFIGSTATATITIFTFVCGSLAIILDECWCAHANAAKMFHFYVGRLRVITQCTILSILHAVYIFVMLFCRMLRCGAVNDMTISRGILFVGNATCAFCGVVCHALLSASLRVPVYFMIIIINLLVKYINKQ